jgi:hypothetical protein
VRNARRQFTPPSQSPAASSEGADVGLLLRVRIVLCSLTAGVLIAVGPAIIRPAPAHATSASGGGAFSWSQPRPLDRYVPFEEPRSLDAISCPSPSFCAAVDQSGHVLTTADPRGDARSWLSSEVLPGARLKSISCPEISFCAAVDETDDVVTSTDPSAGRHARWQSRRLTGPSEGLSQIACPSAHLCVVVGAGHGADLVTSTDPARAGRASWVAQHISRALRLTGVSCPTLRLCVAVGQDGEVAISTDPMRGSNTSWHLQRTVASELTAVSCASERLCVAVGSAGFLSSTDPRSAADWSRNNDLASKFANPNELDAISCSREGFCLATGLGGALALSRDPALGQGASWLALDSHASRFLTSVSCLPVLCELTNSQGRVISIGVSAVGAGAPVLQDVDGFDPLFALSCSASLCVAADGGGRILTTTTPTLAAPWGSQVVDPGDALTAPSCLGRSLCVAVDNRGHLFTTPTRRRARAPLGRTL